MLSEAAQSEHVVARIPLAVGDQVQHFALVGLRGHHLLHRGVPDARLAVLGARDEVLGIRRDGTTHHLVLAEGTKESLLDPCSSGRFVLNESRAVISRLHKELVGRVRQDDD